MTDLKEFQRFEQRPLVKPFLQHLRFIPDEGPLLEALEFFEISHGSHQSFNFLFYFFYSD